MLAWKVVAINFIVLALVGCVNEDKNKDDAPLGNIEISCATQLDKNESLWRVLNYRYFWNDELDQSTNLSDFDSLAALIEDVKRKNPQDRFTSIQLPETGSLVDAIENGSMLDNGLTLTFSNDRSAVLAKLVWPNSPASELGIKRGNKIISISGVSIADLLASEEEPQKTIIDLLYNSNEVAIHWQDHNNDEHHGVLSQRRFDLQTVFHSEVINIEASKVGYMVFSMFLPTSVPELNNAFELFIDAEVEHLIIDLRANGGGCCVDGLESQIAGDYVIGNLAGRTIFNDNLSDRNSSFLFGLNDSIPAFNMNSVTFLTSKNSASASEGLISKLSPYIEVNTVGEQTYGKTAGQAIHSICGETVYLTEFTIENAIGERIPPEGLSPTCYVEDTFKPIWGDPTDPVLAEALYLYNNGYCSN
ncbi:S41 family peptidase [Thalassotalea fusca]